MLKRLPSYVIPIALTVFLTPLSVRILTNDENNNNGFNNLLNNPLGTINKFVPYINQQETIHQQTVFQQEEHDNDLVHEQNINSNNHPDQLDFDEEEVKFISECHQPEPLRRKHIDKEKDQRDLLEIDRILYSEEYSYFAASILSGAVQIATESYDENGLVGEDASWDIFYAFAEYLIKTFPVLHKHVSLEKINTHGLLYTWQGSDPSLKPIVLMAHQDVVPVDPSVLEHWIHPPYSGHIDDEFIWGRGSCDTKMTLIAHMLAIESLIETGFTPERTIILSYGFDEEEVLADQGAGHLAKELLNRYGPNGISFVLDEGSGITVVHGEKLALISTTEKGYYDVEMVLSSLGGHTSVPFSHGSGSANILSRVLADVADLEYKPTLSRKNPYYQTLLCAAKHFVRVDDQMRTLIQESAYSDAKRQFLADIMASTTPFQRSYMQTSQAVTILQAGTKINSLPETGKAAIQHRISIDDSVASVMQVLGSRITAKAKQLDLGLTLWNETVNPGRYDNNGNLSVYSNGAIEPAPISPTRDNEPWNLLSGTIRYIWNELGNESVTVSPNIMSANTDTQFYWPLTQNIYRFTPVTNETCHGVHTINERLGRNALTQSVALYRQLIMNADQSQLL